MQKPARGDVWLVDLGFAAKTRPALVISIPLEDEDRALITVICHTTSPCGSRFEVEVKTRFLRPGVFDAQNLVSAPRAKFRKRLGRLTEDQFLEVEKALRFWLGLSQEQVNP